MKNIKSIVNIFNSLINTLYLEKKPDDKMIIKLFNQFNSKVFSCMDIDEFLYYFSNDFSEKGVFDD